MQTIRYGKARMERFHAVTVYAYRVESSNSEGHPCWVVRRAGITSLRRR